MYVVAAHQNPFPLSDRRERFGGTARAKRERMGASISASFLALLIDQLLDRRGVEEETKSLGEDASLVAAIGALKDEKEKSGGAVMAPESGKSEFHVIAAPEVESAEAKHEHVKARRRAGVQHRGAQPILVGGRAHTDPDLHGSDEAPSAKPITQPGIGPEHLEPRPAVVLIVPADTQASESRPQSKQVLASDDRRTDVDSTDDVAEPASGMRESSRRGPLVGFEEARKQFEADLDGRTRNKLFLARETVKRDKLEPSSEAYLLLAEQCVESGCDLSEDREQAELDRQAVYKRRAARGIVDLPKSRAPRRKRTVVVVGLVSVTAAIVGAAFYLKSSNNGIALTDSRPASTVMSKQASAPSVPQAIADAAHNATAPTTTASTQTAPVSTSASAHPTAPSTTASTLKPIASSVPSASVGPSAGNGKLPNTAASNNELFFEKPPR